MKVFRAGVFALALLAGSFAISTPSRAEIRWIDPVQTLAPPAASTFTASDVAIDGDHIIALGGYEGGQQALHYRRNSNGQWVYRRSLLNWIDHNVRSDVAMRNGIAAVQFGNEITLFELAGGDYVRQTSAAPIRHQGGVAISARSVLIGGNNCDYDAVIYQKNSSGSWAITGRLDDNQGECLFANAKYAVELHYDYALVRTPAGLDGVAWRRNGTALDWVRAGTLHMQPNAEATIYEDPYVLQGATAVAPNGDVWRRSGTSTWIRESVLQTLDYDNMRGHTSGPVYRDGVLISIHSASYQEHVTAVHVETSPGQFENVGVLQAYPAPVAYDVSRRTVATAGNNELRVFNLATAAARTPAAGQ